MGPGLPLSDHCHIQQGALGSYHSIREIHLLPLRHWATFLALTKCWGPTLPSCSSIVLVGGQTYQVNQTPPLSLFFRSIPLIHYFLVVLTCHIPLLGRRPPNQNRSLYILCSLYLVNSKCISHSPSSSTSNHILTLLFLYQLASHVDLHVWDTQNPSIVKHHPRHHPTTKSNQIYHGGPTPTLSLKPQGT